MNDDDRNESPRTRIFEAVAIAVLTAAGTKLVEAIAERLKKRRRAKRKKPPASKPP